MRIRRSLLAFALVATALFTIAPGTPVGAITTSMPAKLAMGSNHTCSLDQTGTVWCVGSNSNGQLGDGTTTDQIYPVRVQGGPFASIYAGGATTCALTSTGDAYCWGSNINGTVGDGTTTDRLVPTRINGYTFTSLTMASSVACGLVSGGAAYCWGANGHGQTGNNDSAVTSLTVPTVVYGGLSFKSIVGGALHVCGIRSNDRLYCWGWNTYGQIGDGTSGADRYQPVVIGSSTFKSVSPAYRHTCAIRSDDVVLCWGFEQNGMLGNGGNSNTNKPSPLIATQTTGYVFTQLFSGNNFTCGIDASGTANCFGYNFHGQLGDGTAASHFSMSVGFTGYTGSVWAANWNYSACMITNLGTVRCAGLNDAGQLGIASPATSQAYAPRQAMFVLAQGSASASVAVDPSFSFTVASRATACNGQLAVMVTSTPTSIDLGHLNASTLSGGAHDLSVASNAGNGGVVYLRSWLATRNLVGSSGSIADSGATAPVAGTESFGYTASDANRGLASNTFATLTNANAEVAYSASGSISPAQCVGYQVAVSTLTPAGAYSATIIYTAVPSF